MSWDGRKERRKYRRARIRLQLEFEERGEPHRSRLQVQTLDLSAGGFYCKVDRVIEPLTRLGLRFVFPPFGPDHPQPRTIECEAIAVRCTPSLRPDEGHRLAVCFTQMPAEDRRYVDEYVAWYREVFEAESEDGEDFGDPREQGVA